MPPAARPTSSTRRNSPRPPLVNRCSAGLQTRPEERGMLCLLLLPVHLALALLWLPFLALKLVFRFLAMLIVLPIVLLVGALAAVIGGLAFFFAVLIPLAPFLIVALLIYALTRRSPAASAARG